MPKTKAPPTTLEEANYFGRLIKSRTPVTVVMLNGDSFSGVIEYYDSAFFRLTRENAPNLFLYKAEVKYFFELGLPPDTE